MPSKINWQFYWSIRAQCDPEFREKWDRAVGFLIDPVNEHVKIDPALNNYISHCSVPELVDFLSGAPLPIVKIFLYRLPLKYAKKTVLAFRVEDIQALEAAYFKPTRLIDSPK